VRVGWDEASLSEVEACHGDAESVEAGKLSRECWSDGTSCCVFGVTGVGQAMEHEVVCRDGCRALAHETVDDGTASPVGYTKVLFWVSI